MKIFHKIQRCENKLLPNQKKSRGATLIELLIYSGLLGIILIVIYNLLVQSGRFRSYASADYELLSNSKRAVLEITNGVKSAALITSPAFRNSGPLLNLDNNKITFSLLNNRLIRTENGNSDYVTGNLTTVKNLNFNVLGPSTEKPTVYFSFTLSINTSDGIKTENYQSAVTLR